jgi:hypothetical protein
LNSFTAFGNQVSLYSYEAIGNLPPGVLARDANEILPSDALNDFPIDGIPSIVHFSDYFRYTLFATTDEIWIDTDMLSLRAFDLDAPGEVIGRSSAASLSTALLRLVAHDPRLHELLKCVEAKKHTDSHPGDTGARLLTAIYGVQAGMPASLFYPMEVDQCYKVLLPRYLDECTTLCNESYALHLWTSRLMRMGLYKRIGPPVGSFLHQVFGRTGANGLFREFYPADVMQTMIENAVEKVGPDEGLRKLFQVGVPLIRSAIGRKFSG